MRALEHWDIEALSIGVFEYLKMGVLECWIIEGEIGCCGNMVGRFVYTSTQRPIEMQSSSQKQIHTLEHLDGRRYICA